VKSSSRWRTGLAGPQTPVGREELGFLVGSAVVILVTAQLTDPGTPLEVLALLPAVAAFVARGLVPRLLPEAFAVAVLVPVALVVGHAGNLEGSFFLTVMVSLYTAWHLGITVRSLLILAANMAVAPLAIVVLARETGVMWMPWTCAAVFTFLLGLTVRRQEILIAELEAARQALAEQAVAEERRRIARELHDLAGHTLAAVLLHVTGARHVLRRDVDEAERALRDAEAVGRTSLDQIRATVAALRSEERGTDPALAGSADLAALADEYRRAGLEVSLSLAPEVARVEGPAGTAVHRICREALANVARHAPANRVRVAVAGGPGGEASIVVSDHGRPAPSPPSGAGHYGLIGMRERARALGGDLDAGPTADGWRVTARIPLDGQSPDGAPGCRDGGRPVGSVPEGVPQEPHPSDATT